MHRRDLLLSALLAGLAGCAVPAWPTGRAEEDGGVRPGSGPTLDAPPTALFGSLAERLVRHCGQDVPNLVLSPWSIGVVLAMVRGGASGATAVELDAALGVRGPLPASVNTVWNALAADAGLHLAGADRVWAEESLAWEPAYLDHLAAFGAPLRRAAIAADPERVRRAVNAWVARETKDLIPELIESGLIDAATRLVLVNALHARGAWVEPMVPAGRHPFTTTAGERRPVNWLTAGGPWPWAETDDVAGTAIPVADSDAALVVLKPKNAGWLPLDGPRLTRESRRHVVTEAHVAAVLDAEPGWVRLGMPAWRVASALSLAGPLRLLGVRDAFDRARADLSGMTTQDRLHLDFLEHQAVLTVDEKGFEGAAATAAGVAAGAAPVILRELTLDRPFGFALVHAPTRTILFTGHVGDPAA